MTRLKEQLDRFVICEMLVPLLIEQVGYMFGFRGLKSTSYDVTVSASLLWLQNVSGRLQFVEIANGPENRFLSLFARVTSPEYLVNAKTADNEGPLFLPCLFWPLKNTLSADNQGKY